MISAFEIYFVMQLDDMKSVIGFLMWVATFSTVVALGLAFMAWDEDNDVAKKAARLALRLGVFATVFAGFNAFVPSSRTAAVMFVLPAITSDRAIEAIRPEATELYELAKDALRGLAPPAKTAEPEKAESEK